MYLVFVTARPNPPQLWVVQLPAQCSSAPFSVGTADQLLRKRASQPAVACDTVVECALGFKSLMIGVHLGLILPLAYAAVFAWRMYKAYGKPGKGYIVNLLAAMIAGSLLTVSRPTLRRYLPGGSRNALCCDYASTQVYLVSLQKPKKKTG
eukprot:scaffold912_cov422-Prasinococcus_capsulatus_cf.AAC.11